jgi:hypothetical protein
MAIAFEKTDKFLNNREWRSFLSAASSASYPGVVRAVRAGQAWLSGGEFAGAGAATNSGWLLVEGGLVTEPGETLGI